MKFFTKTDEFLAYTLGSQHSTSAHGQYSLPMAGQTTWFSTRIAPIGLIRWIWLARDITQHKQAEEALQRSEAKFHNIFQTGSASSERAFWWINLMPINAWWSCLALIHDIGIKRTTDFMWSSWITRIWVNCKSLIMCETLKCRWQEMARYFGDFSFRLNTADGYME